MTRNRKPNSPNTLRAAAVVLGSKQTLTTSDVAKALGLSCLTAQIHLSLCRKAGQIVLVGCAQWASPEVGNATRVEIHAAARARRNAAQAARYARLRACAELTFKQEFRASGGKPVQRVRAARSGDAVGLGPNSVFAWAGTLT